MEREERIRRNCFLIMSVAVATLAMIGGYKEIANIWAAAGVIMAAQYPHSAAPKQNGRA